MKIITNILFYIAVYFLLRNLIIVIPNEGDLKLYYESLIFGCSMFVVFAIIKKYKSKSFS